MSQLKKLLKEQLSNVYEVEDLILSYHLAEKELEEDVDGDFHLDEGFHILLDLADTLSPHQVDIIKESLQEMAGLSDEEVSEMAELVVESDDGDNEDDEDEIDEVKKFRIRRKEKRKMALKKKAQSKIGVDKAKSAQFRAKFAFDAKKRRFVKRDKPRSVAQQKRSDRKFTKRLARRRH